MLSYFIVTGQTGYLFLDHPVVRVIVSFQHLPDLIISLQIAGSKFLRSTVFSFFENTGVTIHA